MVGWYEVVDVVLSEGKNCCRGGFKTVLRSKLSEMGRGSSRWFSRCNCQSERILLTAKWWGRERERCHATRPKRPLILIFQSVDIVLSSITHSHASATIELQTLIAGCSTLLESRLKATIESNSAKSFRFVCSVSHSICAPFCAYLLNKTQIYLLMLFCTQNNIRFALLQT